MADVDNSIITIEGGTIKGGVYSSAKGKVKKSLIHIDNSIVESGQTTAFDAKNSASKILDSTPVMDRVINIPILSGSTDNNSGKSENSIVDIKGNVTVGKLLDIDKLYVGTENIKSNLNVTEEQNLTGNNKCGIVYVWDNSTFTIKDEPVNIDAKTNKIVTDKIEENNVVTNNVNAIINKNIDLSKMNMDILKQSVSSKTETVDITYNLDEISKLTVDIESDKTFVSLSNLDYEFTGKADDIAEDETDEQLSSFGIEDETRLEKEQELDIESKDDSDVQSFDENQIMIVAENDEDEIALVASELPSDAIYVSNNSNANDSYTGTAVAPVRTIARAYDLAKNTVSKTICVVGTVAVNNTQTFNSDITILGIDSTATLLRNCTGNLFTVTAGKATFSQIIIDGNSSNSKFSSDSQGSLIYVGSNGEVDIKDSSILQNNTTMTTGGGITNFGETTLEGGSVIKHNYANSGKSWIGGGGIYLGAGTVNIEDATITQNKALVDGGGILVRDGNIVCNGGEISKNSARYGGGLYLGLSQNGQKYFVTLGNVRISENFASIFGGGFMQHRYANVVMEDGVTIENNAVLSSTGGAGAMFYCASDSKLSIKGKIVIMNNWYGANIQYDGDFIKSVENSDSSVQQNIYLNNIDINDYKKDSTVFSVEGALDSNTRIGVTINGNGASNLEGYKVATTEGNYQGSISENDIDKFVSDQGYSLVNITENNKTYMVIGSTKINEVFLKSQGNNTNQGDTPSTAVRTFKRAKSLLSENGTIWVCGEIDVTGTETWTLETEQYGTATVKRWDGNKDVLPAESVNIPENVTPYLENMVNISGNGELILKDITLDGNKQNVKNSIRSAVIVRDTNSKLIMSSGSIICNNDNISTSGEAECRGGGINLINGSLTMESGSEVSGNGSDKCFAGGGIAILGKATLIVDKGATIKNNKVSSYGGGIALYVNSNDGSTINIHEGANIIENTALVSGGGIGIYPANDKAQITISGTFSGNQAPQGSAIDILRANKVNLFDAIITGNITTSDISDDKTRTGGAVYFDGKVLNIKGNTKVFDNINEGSSKQDNIYLKDTKFITIDGALTGEAGSIGVTPSDNSIFKLVAKPGEQYTIADTDKEVLVHDRITNKIDNARYIIYGVSKTGDNISDNLVLGGKMINVTVPTEYLFAGIPNVFGNNIVAPNYKIVNNSQNYKVQVDVAFNNGVEEDNPFNVAATTKLNNSQKGTGNSDNIVLKITKPTSLSDGITNGFFIENDATNTTGTESLIGYNDISGTKVFTLGTLDKAGKTDGKSIGIFTFTGEIPDYDAMDTNLNLHSKFKLILKFTVK